MIKTQKNHLFIIYNTQIIEQLYFKSRNIIHDNYMRSISERVDRDVLKSN